ncbi:MAG: L-asparaginase [Actinomycetia bacterium]|nr:L-asparaginase [Actinomycetes bacterium]
MNSAATALELVKQGTELPKVVVVGTGGTIHSVGKNSLDIVHYGENKTMYDVTELLATVTETALVTQLVPVPYKAVGSPSIGPETWVELVDVITSAVEENQPAGVVVTHGTASLEETAYFLNLTLHVDVPVVVVGSQRPISGISTDGAINLVNALRVAADPSARGMGVMVLLNDEIHSAREVAKTSTLRMQTFRTRDFGVLGHADADKISFYRQPVRKRAPWTEFTVKTGDKLPRVDISYSYAGDDGAAIDAFTAAGAKGIISAGFAPGGTTDGEREAFNRAADAGLQVVISTRVGSGRVVEAEGHRPRGSIPADNLTPQKARILLMLALSSTSDPAEIRRIFATY